MKNTAKVSQIRALSSTGLPPEGFIVAVLEALHDVIPSDRNLFDWTDGEGRLTRYFFEGPVDHAIAKHYFDEFHNRRELEVMPSFKDTVTGKASVMGAAQLDNPEFYRSALYNEIWRPQRLRTRIETIVRRPDGSPLGSLVLYRGPGDLKFTATEERLLQQVAPYVARGLIADTASQCDGRFASSPTTRAFVCLDSDGQVTQLSADAHRLLLLAQGDLTPDSASKAPSLVGCPVLSTLWRQWHGQRDAFRDISMQVKNAWGLFVFQGCSLRAPTSQRGICLHISVSHLEFDFVAARRAVDSFELTPAQKEVCLLIQAGISQTAIAARLRVAPATVIDHVRKIYAKLDVHSTLELVNLINDRKNRAVEASR
jgi:DNA-binding CsgD family transcriptional regulator